MYVAHWMKKKEKKEKSNNLKSNPESKYCIAFNCTRVLYTYYVLHTYTTKCLILETKTCYFICIVIILFLCKIVFKIVILKFYCQRISGWDIFFFFFSFFFIFCSFFILVLDISHSGWRTRCVIFFLPSLIRFSLI